ncbi:MAG: hypothetical protein EXS03_09195 [Phycisphaerales bacterium]|nr:hypothetical protein [Phycisphaerales bacterium]
MSDPHAATGIDGGQRTGAPRRVVRVDSVDFVAVHPWLELLRAIHPALRPSRLAIAFITLLLIMGAGRVWDAFAAPMAFEPLSQAIRSGFYECIRATAAADPSAALAGLVAAAWHAPRASWMAEPWFTVCFVLVGSSIFSLGAGVLARLFAGDLAGHSWTIAQARAFLRSRRIALITAPAMGGAIGGALWCVLFVAGALFNIPLFNVIAAALGGLWLALAALAVVAWAAVIFGFPMLAPAVACDGCDGVESAQRAGAYMLARPFHYLWFVVVSLVALCLASVVFDATATAIWHVAMSALSSGLSEQALSAAGTLEFLTPARAPEAASLGATDTAAVGLLDLWRTVLRLMIGAAVLSTAVSLATRTYLLLRRTVDGPDLGDLWMDAPPATDSPS